MASIGSSPVDKEEGRAGSEDSTEIGIISTSSEHYKSSEAIKSHKTIEENTSRSHSDGLQINAEDSKEKLNHLTTSNKLALELAKQLRIIAKALKTAEYKSRISMSSEIFERVEEAARDYLVKCAPLSCIHENPLHSTVVLTSFTLVLGMLTRDCHIVTQSSFHRSYHSLSSPVRSVPSLPGLRVSLDPCHPICATRGVIRPPLRLGD
ncbi:unnamed protein product [Protopolystoma xenopodis]|uniref:Uncharacterized protein n=1 Tax=Protopolystoma xenopodis TaxID=117903 RepID=A0A448XCN6_9PLAT|nr:unnamed protein product [Protopolystoma xenopodis]